MPNDKINAMLEPGNPGTGLMLEEPTTITTKGFFVLGEACMKMNLFQQVGLAGFLGGIILVTLRYWKGVPNALLTQLDFRQGTVGVILPPDWAIAAFLISGLLLLTLGTVWRALRRERSESAAG